MSDLSPETNKLLELARGGSTLSDARRLQIKAGLLSQIAAGGALGAAATHAALGKAAWFSGSVVKGISTLALLSAVGVGLYVGVRAAKEPHPAEASAQSAAPALAASSVSAARSDHAGAPSTVHAANPSAPSSDVAEPSVAEPSVAEPSVAEPAAVPPSGDDTEAASPSPSANGSNAVRGTITLSHSAPGEIANGAAAGTPDTLAGETRLLRNADQALRGGNARLALSILDADAARYPHGVLTPERSAERMIARCMLGQVEAKAARDYLASHANSAFAARIEDACGPKR
jgi:hypothetical protein